jgi:hypothetical protein
LFDFGRPRVREAEQRYMQAVNLLAEDAINARSESREAYLTYRSAYEISGHYRREVLPLRRIAFDQAQLQFKSMLIDVFTLVTESRQVINATVNGIEAKRDFWLAHTDLSVAVLGGGGIRKGGTFSAAKAVLATKNRLYRFKGNLRGRKLPGIREEFGGTARGRKYYFIKWLVWLCWQSAANCSPCVKFPDHRENRGNFINIGPIVRYSALTQQSIGGKIP